MYKIAFDIRAKRLAGIYRYGSALLEHLGSLLPSTDIKLYLLYRPDVQEQAVQEISHHLSREQFELVAVTDNDGRIPRSYWIRNWLVHEGINLYYSIDFVVDKELAIPYVYTIHDIFLHKYPEYFYDTNEKFQAKFGMSEFNQIEQDLEAVKTYIPDYVSSDKVPTITKYIWAMSRYLAKKSVHIITSTQSSKEEVTGYLSVPASKVTVIPAAADASCFYPRSHEEAALVIQKYDLPKNYCLGVGLELKHKRLYWLLETLAKYRDDFPPHTKVAIVGTYNNLSQWLEQIHSLGLDHLIVFTGRVSDEELASLYTKARALIVPSLDEGFGIPTVEALSCGTEVIVPDRKVPREVAGPCGHYYGVHDQNQLGNLIVQAFQGTLPLRAKYFEKRFDWGTSTRQFLDLLKSMLNEETTNARFLS